MSFYDAFKILSSEFTVHVATPNARQPDFASCDYRSRSLFKLNFNEYKTKSASTPIALASVNPELYSSLVLPHSPGALVDLATNKHLGDILRNFVRNQKTICAVGLGVAGLFPAFEDGNIWSFRRFTLTTISVFELVSNADFSNLPLIPEDVIKDRGALYSCTNSDRADEVHVVVDRHLVTGQNEKSTTTAVQNLVILCNEKNAKNK